jgi:DNA-binding transcriptional LysR family regulator
MLDVRKLCLLRDLAHRGTIAAVAQARSYTPSAVSQQLAALEREAGVALLARTGRRVELTVAGMVLVRHAEAVLAALEQADAALDAARTGLVGPLRIGAFPTAVRTLLPAALVALGRDHPGLELRVTEMDPAHAPAALRAGELDVALVHDYDLVPIEPDPAIESEQLVEETMFLATAGVDAEPDAEPDMAAGARDATDPVGRHRSADWILGSTGTVCHTMAVRTCQAAGFNPRARHHADDFRTVLSLVAAGQGVALVPQLAAMDAGTSVVLHPLPTRRRTRIAFRRGSSRHPAVAACAAAIRAATEAYLATTPAAQRLRMPGG